MLKTIILISSWNFYFHHFRGVYYYYISEVWWDGVLWKHLFEQQIENGKNFIPHTSTQMYCNSTRQMWKILFSKIFVSEFFLWFWNFIHLITISASRFITKVIKWFTSFILNITIHNILNEKGLDRIIEEIVNQQNFENSETETKACKSEDDLIYPQESLNNCKYFRWLKLNRC